MLVGNLTRDPEIKWLPSGVPVANFTIATNRIWTNRDGNKQEQSEFHDITVYGKLAQTTGEYLKKGQLAYVEGRLHTRSWDADDGTKRYRTEIIAERVQFGPKKSEETDVVATNSVDDTATSETAPVQEKEEQVPF